MAIRGPELSEMTEQIINGTKPKPTIQVVAHRQRSMNRPHQSNVNNHVTQPEPITSYSMLLNEGGVNGFIPASTSNYFHSVVDPLPSINTTNDINMETHAKPTVLTLFDLASIMDTNMKSKAFYKVLMDLISPSNMGSIRYQRFMKQHAGFIVYYAYINNGCTFDYEKFKTVMFIVNGKIADYFVWKGDKIYDDWMRIYSKLLNKLHG
jgi:hypothetical protein